MSKKQSNELPSIINSSPDKFVDEMNEYLPELNKYLLKFMTEQETVKNGSVEKTLFIQEYCFPFEDRLELLKSTVSIIQNQNEKKGTERGKAKIIAKKTPLGEMMQKYQRVYNRLPSSQKLHSGNKSLKRIIKETREELAK